MSARAASLLTLGHGPLDPPPGESSRAVPTTVSAPVEPTKIDVVGGPGSVEVRLQGDIDLVAQPQLSATLVDLAALGQPITIDMSGVTFIDSTGMSTLVVGNRNCKEAGTTLTLCRVP